MAEESRHGMLLGLTEDEDKAITWLSQLRDYCDDTEFVVSKFHEAGRGPFLRIDSTQTTTESVIAGNIGSFLFVVSDREPFKQILESHLT